MSEKHVDTPFPSETSSFFNDTNPTPSVTPESTMSEPVEIPKRVYGWNRDLPSNDTKFFMVANPRNIKKFPKRLIINNLPDVYDQGSLGSCTANALGVAFGYEKRKEHGQIFTPSRLFIYYNERKMEDNIPFDTGAMIETGIKTLTNEGTCPESIWPYEIEKFTECPVKIAYDVALDNQVLASRKVPETVEGFKTMINMGLVVVFGFTVFESFESEDTARTGIMKMPKPFEKKLGGHAVTCIGYDDDLTFNGLKGYLKIRNSWGIHWGIQGDFWMPYDFVNKSRLVSDLWVITKSEGPMVKLNLEMSKSFYQLKKTEYSNLFARIINRLKTTIKLPKE
jgi:C1A family cysteine protease